MLEKPICYKIILINHLKNLLVNNILSHNMIKSKIKLKPILILMGIQTERTAFLHKKHSNMPFLI